MSESVERWTPSQQMLYVPPREYGYITKQYVSISDYDALLAERDALREAGAALACSLTAFHDVGTPHADCSPCEALSAWRAATGEDA